MSIGNWTADPAGLPAFEYTGKLPYRETLPNGEKVKLPEDPWFLLGNYRLTLFTHVNGEYELISGQRSWAKVNFGGYPNKGANASSVSVDGKEYALTGMDSIAADPDKCRRIFGCGFANYEFDIDGVLINKNLSVKPSKDIRDGASAFLMTVSFRNMSDSEKTVSYHEWLGVKFVMVQHQGAPDEYQPVKYAYEFSGDNSFGQVNVTAVNDDPLLFGKREDMSRLDGYPPAAFMRALSDETAISGDEKGISADTQFTLAPSEEKILRLIIGFAFDGANEICEELANGSAVTEPVCAFADDWLGILPQFENEPDKDLRRELIWHAYTLEAMATYSEYYDETKIPQGTIYDYHWGQHASARDNYQHALPLCYYDPMLAKSVLRYMLKRTTPYGEIRLIESGNGYADNERYFTSDQQLYFFLLLGEYLKITGDYEFLRDKIQPFPVKGMAEMTAAELTEKCFIYLRDTVGVGAHGLVRLLNCDWNDAVYYMEKLPYNNVLMTGESHMNSAMAVSILQGLIPELEKAGLNELCRSMSLYRERILNAFLADVGGRSFPRRMYFNGRAYGEDNMFLEPIGFTLQINELSDERKQRLYSEMQKRLYKGEKLGAREQQTPEFEDEGFDKGSRENGGFWWALNGPVIVGMAQLDKSEAMRLLKNMTLKNLSEQFPQYWSSYWSAADTLESSLVPGEGCTDQSDDFWLQPVFCAHPHAWTLYCYYRIME